jgi:2-oxoisovalerate dehydrogenase E1 component
MTKKLDIHNLETAFLFGDAVTATIVNGNDYKKDSLATIDNIELSSKGEDGNTLNIPNDNNAFIQLRGKKLFSCAVKTMSMILQRCCLNSGVSLTNLDLVVPHQANQRISNAIAKYLKIESDLLYSNISYYGNTSSCTIPIALHEVLNSKNKNKKIALCAFGSGFTAAAAMITTI